MRLVICHLNSLSTGQGIDARQCTCRMHSRGCASFRCPSHRHLPRRGCSGFLRPCLSAYVLGAEFIGIPTVPAWITTLIVLMLRLTWNRAQACQMIKSDRVLNEMKDRDRFLLTCFTSPNRTAVNSLGQAGASDDRDLAKGDGGGSLRIRCGYGVVIARHHAANKGKHGVIGHSQPLAETLDKKVALIFE